MSDRAFRLHCARVYLAECSRRRHGPVVGERRHNVNGDFYWTLFGWAQRQRREAAAISRDPVQGGLFA